MRIINDDDDVKLSKILISESQRITEEEKKLRPQALETPQETMMLLAPLPFSSLNQSVAPGCPRSNTQIVSNRYSLTRQPCPTLATTAMPYSPLPQPYPYPYPAPSPRHLLPPQPLPLPLPRRVWWSWGSLPAPAIPPRLAVHCAVVVGSPSLSAAPSPFPNTKTPIR
ncbi:uncharacterized protein LOC134785470 [Penaeus indicus]|uniref:uncharacterized protein LOC134785470 n=1 Tax=Penaeus indicus TaxID=29960 RepID=UPI00300D8A75